MSEINRVKQWLRSDRLVRPSSGSLNFVDLVLTLAVLTGKDNAQTGPGTNTIRRWIGPAEHYVLVLVDGMGMKQLEVLPEGSFLRSFVVGRLQSVFLSTTATALTTLATGHWPCTHSVPGWWTYLHRQGVRAVTLPFAASESGKPLEAIGISPEEFFPVRSFWPDLKYRPLSVMPEEICNSTYSKYVTGGTSRLGYAGIRDALEKAAAAVRAAPGPSFTYLYLPQLDALCHKKGTNSEEVSLLIQRIDQSLRSFTADLADRARIVITADHGHTDIPRQRIWVLEDELISSLLCTAPTGESNVPIFHVLPGREAEFAAEFRDRFGDFFALLRPEEIESLGLLGPARLSDAMKARLGTFVGISAEPAAICTGPAEESGFLNVGFHGGLTPSEMFVGLIVPETPKTPSKCAESTSFSICPTDHSETKTT